MLLGLKHVKNEDDALCDCVDDNDGYVASGHCHSYSTSNAVVLLTAQLSSIKVTICYLFLLHNKSPPRV